MHLRNEHLSPQILTKIRLTFSRLNTNSLVLKQKTLHTDLCQPTIEQQIRYLWFWFHTKLRGQKSGLINDTTTADTSIRRWLDGLMRDLPLWTKEVTKDQEEVVLQALTRASNAISFKKSTQFLIVILMTGDNIDI